MHMFGLDYVVYKKYGLNYGHSGRQDERKPLLRFPLDFKPGQPRSENQFNINRCKSVVRAFFWSGPPKRRFAVFLCWDDRGPLRGTMQFSPHESGRIWGFWESRGPNWWSGFLGRPDVSRGHERGFGVILSSEEIPLQKLQSQGWEIRLWRIAEKRSLSMPLVNQKVPICSQLSLRMDPLPMGCVIGGPILTWTWNSIGAILPYGNKKTWIGAPPHPPTPPPELPFAEE